MPRKQKKYHFVYKTTNVINNKYYVGMHSTDDLDDGYIGSGKYLWRSIRKYGKENFICEILEFFDNRELLVENERITVNDDLLKDHLCMNLMKGGEGGLQSPDNVKKWRLAGTKRMKELFDSDPFYKLNLSRLKSEMNKKHWAQGMFDKGSIGFTNKTHTDETKIKMSHIASLKLGHKNSQFGTCWIYKQNENKKIKNDELDKWLSIGWVKGRFLTDDHKNKCRENKISQQGNKNSQFGTCWIFNEIESKKIKIEKLDNYLIAGWKRGRKIKF